MIERIAVSRGHEIVLKIDRDNRSAVTDEELGKAEMAIEFSTPETAVENCRWCFDNGIPVVAGTTGWLDDWDALTDYCREKGGSFFYASNFSIGVNIFFHLNRYLARMMSGFNGYGAFVEETHHIHKLDAPSGTAITIAEGIMANHPDYTGWQLEEGKGCPKGVLPVTARRIGEVPGIHGVVYKSSVDQIEIRHTAFSREGFAQGAVLAAEFLLGKKGIWGMDDMLKLQ